MTPSPSTPRLRTMDAERLETVGRAMFGTYWQAEIARLVGRSSRMVRFWATGGKPIPDKVANRIEAEALERSRKLRWVVNE